MDHKIACRHRLSNDSAGSPEAWVYDMDVHALDSQIYESLGLSVLDLRMMRLLLAFTMQHIKHKILMLHY